MPFLSREKNKVFKNRSSRTTLEILRYAFEKGKEAIHTAQSLDREFQS